MQLKIQTNRTMPRAMRAFACLLVIATARSVTVTSYEELAAAVKAAEPTIEISEPSLQIREAITVRSTCTIECVAPETDCFLEWTGTRQRGAMFKIEGQNVLVTMKRLWLFGHGASSRRRRACLPRRASRSARSEPRLEARCPGS